MIPITNRRCGQISLMLFTCFLFVLIGCSSDALESYPSTSTDFEENSGVVLRLKSNQLQKLGSQVTSNYENHIQEAVALVFQEEIQNKEQTFLYQAECSDIKWDPKTQEYEMIAHLQKPIDQSSAYRYNLVILGNVKAQAGSLSQYKGTPRDKMLKTYLFKSDGEGVDYVWNANATTPTYIPMFGEYKDIKIEKGSIYSESIQMLRALAKISLYLGPTPVSTYSLDEVVMYNSVNKGYVAPKRVKVDENESFIDGQSLAREDINPAIHYQYAKDVVNVDTELNPILLAEHSGIAEGYYQESTQGNVTLVVGLSQFDSTNQKTEVLYYRLNSDELEKIQRNYQYQITISDVRGNGAKTPEEALKNEVECTIELDICDWHESKFNHYLEGDYYFSIVSSFVSLTSNHQKQGVSYKTNLSSKDIKVLEKPNFFEFYIDDVAHELVFELVVGFPMPYKHHAKIQAGNMVITIPVIYFPETAPADQDLKIETTSYARGIYVRGEPLKGMEHYLECTVALAQGNKADLSEYSHVRIRTPEVNGYAFDGVFDLSQIDILSSKLKVPGAGIPKKASQTSQVDHFPVSFEFIPKLESTVNPALHESEVDVELLYMRPIAHGVKVLMIAADYDILTTSSVRGNQKNLGYLLKSEGNFGLQQSSSIKVSPFKFIGPQTKWSSAEQEDLLNHSNVVCVLKSFSELQSMKIPGFRYIEDYDVIIFIRAAWESRNEVYNSHANSLIEFMENPNKVFIQTPSLVYSEGLIGWDKDYTDRILLELYPESKEENIGRSSAWFSNARPAQLLTPTVYESLLNEPFGLENRHVYFPVLQEENKRILEHFSDFQYFDVLPKEFQNQVLGQILVAKESAPSLPSDILDLAKHMDEWVEYFKKVFNNSIDRPVIMKSNRLNHLWIGSSYFFSDAALRCASNGKPETYVESTIQFGPIKTGSSNSIINNILDNKYTRPFIGDLFNLKNTENARFTVNMFHWAIMQTDKVIDK